MTHEESIQAAEAILLQAGWRPHPDWGRFTKGTLVCGVQPDGSAIHVKDWARIPPGHPLYGPDTPDEAHEAAAWLVERFGPKPLAEAGEAGESAGHEVSSGPDDRRDAAPPSHEGGELGMGDGVRASTDAGAADGELYPLVDGEGPDDDAISHEGDALDADFTDPDDPAEIDAAIARELLESDGHDLGEELLDEPAHMSGEDIVRVYGLDDLDRRKTVAIGLVMRHARDLMPYWTTDHDTALRELRNHVMGAAEDRWDLIPERQAELDELEATLRRRRAIEQARDDKVAFIEAADRAAFDAFVVEEGWP